MARRLALLLVTLALGACGGVASSAPMPTPAVATPPAPTDVPTAPPATFAIPEGVTPATDEVVLRVWAVPDVVGGELLPVTVYADGSILVPEVERFNAPGVRRLTATGLAGLLVRLRAGDLFASSRTIPPLRPPESGFTTYRIELHDAGRVVSVEAGNLAPAPEARTLIDLAESILRPAEPVEPADWVGGSAAPLPYRARTTRLTSEIVAFPAGSWRRPAVDVGRLAWPLEGTPVDIGAPIATPDATTRTIRCALIGGADEARLRQALEAAGAEPGAGDMLTRSWDLSAPAVPGILRLAVRPFLPEELPGCDVVPLPEAPAIESPASPAFADFWEAADEGVRVDGQPLVRVQVTRGGGEEIASLLYASDGSILQLLDPPPPAIGVGVRSLSSAGLAQLRVLLADPELPGADLVEMPPAGVQEFTSYRVEGLLRGASRTVEVTDARPSREASAVIALARSLVEPDRWAGGDGWRDGNPAVQAWMPFRVQLLVDQLSDVQTASTHPAASTVRWPFEGTLEEPRCEVLGFTETDVLVRAFNTVGVEDSGGWALQGEYLMAAGTPDTLLRVTLTVLQPGEQDSCETIGF